jgi:FkbM family methyltransferase
MIIDIEEVINVLASKKITLNGCFHIGAHECEELSIYNNKLGIKTEDIVWVDALPSKVYEATIRGIPNVFNAVITDKDDEKIAFNVANNGQSSSILEFGTHSIEHPGIVFINKINQKSITVDSFFERNNLDASKYDFWNFDIQGAELLALKGATKSIKHAKVLYLEVNSKELYINGALINEIDEFLAQYNFKRVLTNMTIHKWGDAMYILDT